MYDTLHTYNIWSLIDMCTQGIVIYTLACLQDKHSKIKKVIEVILCCIVDYITT